ncbi:glycosyltransferase [Bacteroidetes/Chlorobi group bacterium ChocPot_Mid]|nr:MAG: glycosyltransferase [Bacteroidetes/Chlorobi group bacterium ChocPot_Mid]
MTLSPIIVFAYKRPQLLRQTLESLSNNHLADESDLFIFCDGPKPNANESDLQKIAEVRKVAREKQWCKSVTVYESETNKGLGPSVISGVTKIVNEFGKVIVLEDDLLTSPFFLEYMNTALDKYEHEERVMHISGYMFPIKQMTDDLFFFRLTTCWGWGTWKRAWDKLETNPNVLKQKLKKSKLYEYFNLEGHGDFALQLDLNIRGILNTWAVRWYASVILNGGLSLHPGKSYVENIGFGEDASNTKKGSSIYHINELADKVNIYDIPLEESIMVRDWMMKFYDSARRNSYMKFLFKHYTGSFIVRNIILLSTKLYAKKLI